MNNKKLFASIVLAFSSVSAWADLACNSSYGFRVDVNGNAGSTICATKAQTIIDTAKNFSLSNQGYTRTSAAYGEGVFNDVDFTLHYDANSTSLVFNAPEIGIANQTFDGNTRRQSEDMFEDWLKKSGVIGAMMQYQSKTSAASPITGAGGIMPTLANTDFATGFDDVSNIGNNGDMGSGTSGSDDNHSGNTASNGNSGGTVNLIGAGVSVSSYKLDNGDRITSTTLPLSYSFGTNANDARSQLIVTVPLTMYSVGSAKGYHAGLGIAHRFPITKNWTLTPGVRYSLTGSVDRATVASVYSGSLMSTYQIPFKHFDLNIGNMVGYYKTGKFSAGDYSFNPDIKQTMLRNGVMLSQPVVFKNHKLAIEYSVIDTRYVGSDRPFLSNMQEFGITLGSHRDQKGKLSFLRAGISYTRAKESNGLTFNFGYWF